MTKNHTQLQGRSFEMGVICSFLANSPSLATVRQSRHNFQNLIRCEFGNSCEVRIDLDRSQRTEKDNQNGELKLNSK